MTRSYIYFVERADGLIKIGRSVNPLVRFAALRREHGELTPRGYIRESELVTEHILHHKFASCRVTGEWFRLTTALYSFVMQFAARTVEEALPDTYVEV